MRRRGRGRYLLAIGALALVAGLIVAGATAQVVKKGNLDASRLTSHGYGMQEPIAENDTPDGRQKNRRVQFKILEKGPSAQRSY